MVATGLDLPPGTRGTVAPGVRRDRRVIQRSFNYGMKAKSGRSEILQLDQNPFSLARKMPLRTTSRITTRSDAALMKFISGAAVSQAANLMIG